MQQFSSLFSDVYLQHDYHHDTKVKPEAATAITELLMMGGRTPETCWAVIKRQKINWKIFDFEIFAVFCMLYVFFWVIPRRLNFISRRFVTLLSFPSS
jgi:hypothetical protein